MALVLLFVGCMQRALITLILLALTSCTTLRGRADDALAQGRFLQAAELYDTVLQNDPSDTQARRLRGEARARAIEQLMTGAHDDRARAREADAWAKMDQLLDLSERWTEIPLSLEVQTRLRAELDATAAEVAASIRVELPASPLVAADKLAGQRILRHGVFAATQRALTEEVARTGIEACRKQTAAASPEAPYWSSLVGSYCSAWAIPAFSPPVLPDTRAGMLVEANISGVEATETAALREAVGRWFTGTRWYASNAPRAVTATLGGQFAVGFSERRVALSAPWMESVPYEDTETYQEPYDESYLDTEYYSESAPSTSYETVSVPCADGTSSGCTESRFVTTNHDEQRSRTVTKTRTAYRTATRSVTRYSDEPRVFRYEGVETTGDY